MVRVIFLFEGLCGCTWYDCAGNVQDVANRINSGSKLPDTLPDELRLARWAQPISSVGVVVVHPVAPPITITRRELDVIYGLARGLSVAQIALELGVKMGTVYSYVYRLVETFGGVSYREMVEKLVNAGMLGDELIDWGCKWLTR